jgi:hypothetical protein
VALRVHTEVFFLDRILLSTQQQNYITLQRIEKDISSFRLYKNVSNLYTYIFRDVHNIKHIRTHFKTYIKGRITRAPREETAKRG